MPLYDWEKIDEFFDADEFGTPATLMFADGSTRQIVGVFDDPYLDVNLGEYDFATSRPRILAPLVELQGVERGGEIGIEGEVFDVLSGPRPDGTGLANLDLAPKQG